MSTKNQFNSFEEMLSGSDVPVLVDFYADWCGPCQMMSPILEQVNAQLGDRIRVVKIDTEKYPQLASTYQIYALPTLVLFKQGQPVDRIEGVLQAPQLVQRLQPLV
ncbi:MAG: thioredoxin [Heteroscytonema crispum UTEX LB 1556]